jgi:hypothetical protein
MVAIGLGYVLGIVGSAFVVALLLFYGTPPVYRWCMSQASKIIFTILFFALIYVFGATYILVTYGDSPPHSSL